MVPNVAYLSATGFLLLVFCFLLTWIWLPELSSFYYDGFEIRNLTEIYVNYNETPGFHHWIDYGVHYQRNVEHLLHKKEIRVLEMGVQSGGSTRVWRQFFGKRLRYIGMDIEPNCSKFEAPMDHIHIEIGSQLSVKFLQHLCSTFGPFDFIVDDAGHHTDGIVTSLNALWTCLNDNGVYAIEDLHSMAFFGGPSMVVNGLNAYGHVKNAMLKMIEYLGPPSKYLIDPSSYQGPPDDPFARHLAAVHTYDSLVFLHYREEWKGLTRLQRGGVFDQNSSSSAQQQLPPSTRRMLASQDPHFLHVGVNLTQIYDEYNEDPGLDTWLQFAGLYQFNIRHLLHQHCNDSAVHILEVGVRGGGTARVWHQVFGRRLRYVGLAASDATRRVEYAKEGIHIEVGSQMDTALLNRLCTDYGPFDLVVDDGLHTTTAILATLNVLWPCMRDKGVYVIQELHNMLTRADDPHMKMNGTDMYDQFYNMMNGMVEYWRLDRRPARAPDTPYVEHLNGLHVYDNVAFMHYQAAWKPLTEFRKGEFFPNVNA